VHNKRDNWEFEGGADCFLGGHGEGRRALANVLFGDMNLGVGLPITYPFCANAFYHYDYTHAGVEGANTYNPQRNFGYGLGYSSLGYGDLKFNKERIARGQDVERESFNIDLLKSEVSHRNLLSSIVVQNSSHKWLIKE